jgi:hypothetical protein
VRGFRPRPKHSLAYGDIRRKHRLPRVACRKALKSRVYHRGRTLHYRMDQSNRKSDKSIATIGVLGISLMSEGRHDRRKAPTWSLTLMTPQEDASPRCHKPPT